MKRFDNDYMRGCHPDVMDRLIRTNLEETPGYGLDNYCKEAESKILEACGLDSQNAKVWFLVGGTQTNQVAIDAMIPPTHGVICADVGHINVHEAGAIESTGHKVIPLKSDDGKLSADSIDNYLKRFYADATWPHMVIPGMVYLSQPTELGTLYSLRNLPPFPMYAKNGNLNCMPMAHD
ncbi:MAG: beta-eliminating lyase-related protein [Muribaculum sp.]|nr:beta-eliminating lyase-related protein [Muribaculum sp.]